VLVNFFFVTHKKNRITPDPGFTLAHGFKGFTPSWWEGMVEEGRVEQSSSHPGGKEAERHRKGSGTRYNCQRHVLCVLLPPATPTS
jgi:hypothetical protein